MGVWLSGGRGLVNPARRKRCRIAVGVWLSGGRGLVTPARSSRFRIAVGVWLSGIAQAIEQSVPGTTHGRFVIFEMTPSAQNFETGEWGERWPPKIKWDEVVTLGSVPMTPRAAPAGSL